MTLTPSKIGVLIVDDHHLVRAGLAALIENEQDMEVVGEAADGLEAVEKATRVRPRVVLMDISMPGMDGIEATRKITELDPSQHVLILTQYDHEEYVRRVVQSGASGYILKSSVVEDLRRAIRAVARGEQYFAPTVSKLMIESYVRSATGQGGQKSTIELTPRENEILQLIVDGHTNQQIAKKLHISVRTVEFHRANLTEKIGVRDTAGLVKYAIQKRMVDLSVPQT
jgi:two-component system, NarL family, response regulator NreC